MGENMEIIREDFINDMDVWNRVRLERIGFSPVETHISQALRDYDETLTVWRKDRTGQYRIVDGTYNTVMQFEWHELNHNKVEHMKKIDARNGFNAANEIRKNEAAIQYEQERKMKDMTENLGRDTHKLVRNIAYGGG